MTETENINDLRIALMVAGLVSIVGIWPFTIFWPSGSRNSPC